MKLARDLREFIELLNSRSVEFVIVGGHAVFFLGLDSLLKNKDATGRDVDAADARRLRAIAAKRAKPE